MNPRMGKLKNIDKFDGLFFGIVNNMSDVIDPQSRVLVETTYEAIIDAGEQAFITLPCNFYKKIQIYFHRY